MFIDFCYVDKQTRKALSRLVSRLERTKGVSFELHTRYDMYTTDYSGQHIGIHFCFVPKNTKRNVRRFRGQLPGIVKRVYKAVMAANSGAQRHLIGATIEVSTGF